MISSMIFNKAAKGRKWEENNDLTFNFFSRLDLVKKLTLGTGCILETKFAISRAYKTLVEPWMLAVVVRCKNRSPGCWPRK